MLTRSVPLAAIAESHANDTATVTDVAKRPVLNSQVLFAGGREIVIFHYGESYRLRETRQGKLILTK